jgi:hypothetical protein
MGTQELAVQVVLAAAVRVAVQQTVLRGKPIPAAAEAVPVETMIL